MYFFGNRFHKIVIKILEIYAQFHQEVEERLLHK